LPSAFKPLIKRHFVWLLLEHHYEGDFIGFIDLILCSFNNFLNVGLITLISCLMPLYIFILLSFLLLRQLFPDLLPSFLIPDQEILLYDLDWLFDKLGISCFLLDRFICNLRNFLIKFKLSIKAWKHMLHWNSIRSEGTSTVVVGPNLGGNGFLLFKYLWPIEIQVIIELVTHLLIPSLALAFLRHLLIMQLLILLCKGWYILDTYLVSLLDFCQISSFFPYQQYNRLIN